MKRNSHKKPRGHWPHDSAENIKDRMKLRLEKAKMEQKSKPVNKKKVYKIR